ncbi:MAG: acetylxylan esterase, partial [Armatimonadetes bacterium]|nr:acetylxylan esterase [Armatimonadota bacterium]
MHRHIMLRVVPLLVCCWTLAPGSLAPAARASAATLTKQPEGNFVIKAENYTASVGADGNLHSLVSGGTEFLLDGFRGLVGGGYITIKEGEAWTAEVFKFTSVEKTANDAITATAENHKLIYKFLPEAIELSFSHTAEPTIWYLTVNPAVTDMLEHDSGETLYPKTLWREGLPHLFDARGANVTLPEGAFYYIAKNALEKPDTDPMVHQIWMPRTWGDGVLTKRIVLHARPTVADAARALATATKGNRIFPGGRPAAIGLLVKMRFPNLTVKGEVELTVNDYLTKKEVLRKTLPVEVGKMGNAQVEFTQPYPPGFYQATLNLTQGKEVLATRNFPFAYDIESMDRPERPADFDKFWDDTLAEQEKIPTNVQLTLFKEEQGYKLYKARFDGLLGRQFHAWLSIPTKEGKYPAHLTLPPSGIHPPYMPQSGPEVVGMSLVIAGQEVEPPAGGYKHWDYWRSGIEKKETYYYRAVFAACSRAIDILAARPETDPSRIFVTGGSQGGGLSYITAALNPKVTMAVCSSPGLFGLEWKLRNLGPSFWPPIDPIDDKGQPLNDPKLLEERCGVVRYFDAANFAPRIQGAVLLNLGLQDQVTSQAGTLAAWSQLKNAKIKALLADPWAGHNG